VIKRLHLGRGTHASSGDANRLVFGAEQSRGAAESVVSLDLTSGVRTRVARSEFRHGFVNWAGAAGPWTVFVDQSHIQGDGSMNVLWRVVAVNPARHERKVLLSNGTKPDPWVPWLGSQDDYVFWSSAEHDAKRTAREWIFHDGWSLPRTVMRHTELTPGTESISGNSLVYLGPPAVPRPGKQVGGDCWRVSLAGGNPEPLTETALVNGCAADAHWIAWTELIDPSTRPVPQEGFLDDPYELWAERLDQRNPELLHHGYTLSGWPVVQNGFVVAWGGDGHRLIQDLEEPRSTVRAGSAGWDLGVLVGDRVAFPHPVGESDDQYVDVVEVSRAKEDR
jgi:hypothetical protein